MNLDPFQEVGAAFLASIAPGKGAMLADEPGLGKTRQAIRAARMYCTAHPEGGFRVGVVCPASAIGVWKKEIAVSDALDLEWRVVSYHDPEGGLGTNTLRAAFAGAERLAVVIIDEAHYAKERASARTKALFGEDCDGAGGLASLADVVFELSGTPTPNNPSEIWAHARALFPDAISWTAADGSRRVWSYWQFVNRFCITTPNWFGDPFIVGGKNLAELRARLAPYVLRRLAKDVLPELPEVRFCELPLIGRIEGLRPTAGIRRGLDAESDLIRETLAKKGVDGLRDIAPHVASLRRVTGLAMVDPLADWIEDWFAAGGGKLALFAFHKDVIRNMQTRLHAARIGHVTVDGSVPAEHRQAIADAFNMSDKISLFLGQNEAAGTALTATGASTAVLMEPEWTPGDNDQIWKRIHRIGQRNACKVLFPSIAGSIHEAITRALVRKVESINALWNDSVRA